jgi:beta-lactam-binding protein with PASTA domain
MKKTFLLLLFLGFVFIPIEIQAKGPVVPNVVGKKVSEAGKILTNSGFTIVKVNYLNTDKKELDQQVISQAPLGGQAASSPTQTITLQAYRYQAPPELVAVPGVIGMTLPAAAESIAKAGLKSDVKYKTPAEMSQLGTIAEQTPAPQQKVPKNSKVTLTVYRYAEQDMVAVPALVGKKTEEANQILKNAGLGYDYNAWETTPDKDKDMKVVSQDPLAGKKVPKGWKVKMKYVKHDPRIMRMPNLIGKTLEEAKKIIREKGPNGSASYVQYPTRDRSKDQKVFGQDPPPDKIIDSGSRVGLESYRYAP